MVQMSEGLEYKAAQCLVGLYNTRYAACETQISSIILKMTCIHTVKYKHNKEKAT